jgi:hypothetical protein
MEHGCFSPRIASVRNGRNPEKSSHSAELREEYRLRWPMAHVSGGFFPDGVGRKCAQLILGRFPLFSLSYVYNLAASGGQLGRAVSSLTVRIWEKT